MKRSKKLVMVAVLSMVFFLFTGCYHAMITSEVEILDENGKGVRTFVAEILHNRSDVPKGGVGQGDAMFRPGNNFNKEGESGVLACTNAELKAKIEEHCALDSAVVTVYEATSSVNSNANDMIEIELADKTKVQEKRGETPSTYIKISVAFDNMDDYFAKMKVLAGKNANKITLAKLEKVDGKLKFTEDVSNTIFAIQEILDKVFADPTIYNSTASGAAAKAYSLAGFPDEEGYIQCGDTGNVQAMSQLKSVTVKIGETSYSEKISDYENWQILEPESTLSVTGTPKKDEPVEKKGCGKTSAAALFSAVAIAGAFAVKRKIAG